MRVPEIRFSSLPSRSGSTSLRVSRSARYRSRIFATFPSFRIEQKCSTNANVKGSHFLRKVKAVARRNKLMYRWVAERGSGSHGTLYIGSRFTVVKDLKKEIRSEEHTSE